MGPLLHVNASPSYMLINEKGIIHATAIIFCPEPGLNVLHLNPFTTTVPVIRGFFPVI